VAEEKIVEEILALLRNAFISPLMACERANYKKSNNRFYITYIVNTLIYFNRFFECE